MTDGSEFEIQAMTYDAATRTLRFVVATGDGEVDLEVVGRMPIDAFARLRIGTETNKRAMDATVTFACRETERVATEVTGMLTVNGEPMSKPVTVRADHTLG